MGEVYSPKQVRRAVNLAAILGWLVVSIWSVGDRWGLYPWAAAFGLPIAFAACWLIGAPVLRRTLRRPLSFSKAALTGGLIAAMMALASIAIGRLNGWRQSNDDTFWFQTGGGDYVREVDGILTAYGWQVVAQNTLILVGMGAAIGMILRAGLGPGRVQNATPKL